MRPSVRFDVFKRDAFTCAYCGRRPPDVTLEVDHIIPRAEGGTDDPENLTTACFDCNRGKGARPLDEEPLMLPDLRDRAELVREREEQLRAYNEVKQAERERREHEYLQVWNAWFEEWRTDSLPRYHVPYEATISKYIDSIGREEVLDAIRITGQRFSHISTNAVRYFVGVCRRKEAERDGLVVKCIYCRGFIVLSPGDDASLDWFHAKCAKDDPSG